MKRVSVLGASVLLAVIGLSTSAHAQVARVKPNVYLWIGDGGPTTLRPNPWPHDFISRHAKTNVIYTFDTSRPCRTDPEDAAAAIFNTLKAEHEAGFDIRRMPILIQDFGVLANQSLSQVCDPQPPTAFWSNDGRLPPHFSYGANWQYRFWHPWPDTVTAGQWTTAMATDLEQRIITYNAAHQSSPMPYPTRWMLDYEQSSYDGFTDFRFDPNNPDQRFYAQTQIMIASGNDPRWSDRTYDVPGFNGMSMQDIWEEYRAYWDPADPDQPPYLTVTGRPSNPHAPPLLVAGQETNLHENFALGLTVGLQPAERPNLRYFLFWQMVMDRVVDATMEATFYEPLRTVFGRAGPMTFYSYDRMTLDGKPDTTGWHREKLSNPNNNVLVATNRSLRTHRNGIEHGNFAFPNDASGRYALNGRFGATPANTGGHPALADSRRSFSALSSPEMYPNTNVPNPDPTGPQPIVSWLHINQPDYYLPPHLWGYTENNVPDTERWRAQLYEHRMELEAIINSGAGGNQGTLAPFIRQWTEGTDLGPVTAGMLIDQLLLMRSKSVPELQAFPGAISDGYDVWDRMLTAYQTVYDPTIARFQVPFGTVTQGVDPFGRIETTLRVPDTQTGGWQEDEYRIESELDLDWTGPNGEQRQIVHALIGVMNLNTPPVWKRFSNLRLNVEARIPAGLADSTVGTIFWLHPTSNTWHQLLLTTPTGTVEPVELRPTMSDGVIRRRFDVPASIAAEAVKANGDSTWRIVFTKTGTSSTPAPSSFPVYLDLFQLTRYPGLGQQFRSGEGWNTTYSGPGSGEDESISPGYAMDVHSDGFGISLADFNLDGEVTPGDLSRFLTHWTTLRPGGDVNVDTEIDANDVQEFLTEYSTAP